MGAGGGGQKLIYKTEARCRNLMITRGYGGRRIHWETDTGTYTLLHIKQMTAGNGNPLQYSCLENPMDRGAWQATVHGFAELDTTEAT